MNDLSSVLSTLEEDLRDREVLTRAATLGASLAPVLACVAPERPAALFEIHADEVDLIATVQLERWEERALSRRKEIPTGVGVLIGHRVGFAAHLLRHQPLAGEEVTVGALLAPPDVVPVPGAVEAIRRALASRWEHRETEDLLVRQRHRRRLERLYGGTCEPWVHATAPRTIPGAEPELPARPPRADGGLAEAAFSENLGDRAAAIERVPSPLVSEALSILDDTSLPPQAR